MKSHDLPLHTSLESGAPKKTLFLFLSGIIMEAVKCRTAGRTAVSVKIPVGTWDCKEHKQSVGISANSPCSKAIQVYIQVKRMSGKIIVSCCNDGADWSLLSLNTNDRRKYYWSRRSL